MQRLLPEWKASLWLVSDHTGSQALRFAAVGVVNTLTDFTIFAILALGLGVNTVLANTVSFSAGVLSSYALNSRFTFRVRHRARSNFTLFFLANALSFLISTLTVVSLELFIPKALAKIVAIAACSTFNFISARVLLGTRPKPADRVL